MKFIKYLFLLLLIVIIGASIYIATLDGNYDIKSTKTIKAPVEVVYTNVNDYKNWKEWGPWYEIDSTIIASYPEITSGVGASYTWTRKEGNGSMKTISLIPNKEIIQQINFGTGSSPEVYWEFNKTDDGTDVTWGMRGENSFSEKAYFLAQGGVEKNMKPMFDRGLELLEQYILKEMDKHSFDFKGVVDYGGGYYLYQTTSCKMDEIDTKMGKMLTTLINYVAENNIESSGKPFMLFHKWDVVNNATMFSVCSPIKERIITTGDVLTGFLKPQKTFKTIFKGNYKFSDEAWLKAYKAIEEQELKAVENGESFEVYTVNPHDTENPAEWVTEIYIPIE
ncbi:SRPBCC family protein [Lutibacter sp. B1]|uniref:SRPBCC family protein n=1 Tax=Lutibacter sp. B1 TaxID=2725996 RepID=UPI001456A431|nr:SRPBCC family protein [Lutibacter sp. B1]NLP58882.1 AraC family transcriptional regulator [Lutibacter sp. B1]